MWRAVSAWAGWCTAARIARSDRGGCPAAWRRSASPSVAGGRPPASIKSSPGRFPPGAQALTMRPWWNPMPAFASPQFSVSVPVRPPRWMNCSASATETSSMLPERLMRLLPAHQRDEAFQRLQLAIGIRIDARSEQRRGGMRRDQIEQVAVLGPEHRLVVKQLEDDQRAHRRALHRQRHAGEGLRAVDGPDAQHSVGKRRIHRWISAAVDPVRIEPGLGVLHALGERDLTFARAVPGVV